MFVIKYYAMSHDYHFFVKFKITSVQDSYKGHILYQSNADGYKEMWLQIN